MKPHLRSLVALAAFALAMPLAQAKPAAEKAHPGGKLVPGSYECWNFNRPQLMLNFKLQDGGRYRDYENKGGSYTYDAASGKLAFKGGALDGQSTVYEISRGKPKASFRNAHGNEIAFCEPASR